MKKLLLVAASVAAFTAAPVFAAPMIGNTGKDQNWKVAFLGNGSSPDALNTATFSKAVTLTHTDHAWWPNDAVSSWIALNSDVSNSQGWYAYQNTFFAEATDTLKYEWAVDDRVVSVFLNGVDTGKNYGGTYTWFSEDTLSGFVTGANTLTFLVSNNYPGTNNGANPTGFNFANLSAVPEPATWAMMFVGFGMVAGAARYRRRATSVRFA